MVGTGKSLIGETGEGGDEHGNNQADEKDVEEEGIDEVTREGGD